MQRRDPRGRYFTVALMGVGDAPLTSTFPLAPGMETYSAIVPDVLPGGGYSSSYQLKRQCENVGGEYDERCQSVSMMSVPTAAPGMTPPKWVGKPLCIRYCHLPDGTSSVWTPEGHPSAAWSPPLGCCAFGDDVPTGQDAATQAAARLHHVIDVIRQMESVSVPWDYVTGKPVDSRVDEAKVTAVANKVASFRSRVTAWTKTISTALESGVINALNPLYALGVGLQKVLPSIFGSSAGSGTTAGTTLLNQVQLFETEALQLCAEVQQATYQSVAGCKPLAKPTATKVTGGIEDTAKTLLGLGVASVAAWYGIPAFVRWLERR